MNSIHSELDAFLTENQIDSVGRLCVLLYVADRLTGLRCPYTISDIVTEKGGQVRGLSGPSVRKILASHGITVSAAVLGEAGRTNRGSVRNAEKFIEWLNGQFNANKFEPERMQSLGVQLASKIGGLLNDEQRILNLLPTSDPDYLGPRFVVADDGLSLDPEPRNYSSDIPIDILNELKRIVAALVADLGGANNCYHSLRACLARYEQEANRAPRSLRIPVLYVIGIEIQNHVDALARSKGDDPPLNSDRTANVQSMLALHGVLIASTDAGRKLLDAAAFFNPKTVDIEAFKSASVSLALAASDARLADHKSVDILISASNVAGSGSNPERSTHIAVTTSNNAWSTIIKWCIALAIEQSIQNSGFGKQLFGYGGQLFDVAIAFFNAHAKDFAALANSAPVSLGWIPKALEWIRTKLNLQ